MNWRTIRQATFNADGSRFLPATPPQIRSLSWFVFCLALIPATYLVWDAGHAVVYPLAERDAEGHPLCPSSPLTISLFDLALAAAIMCLAGAVSWPAPIGYRRRLCLLVATVGFVGVGIHNF